MTDQYQEAAAGLVRTDAGLADLIRFARTYDPTATLRAEWGTEYAPRLAAAHAKAQATFRHDRPFDGPAEEVLLCMADLVTTAPYMGLTEDQVAAVLRRLVRELV